METHVSHVILHVLHQPTHHIYFRKGKNTHSLIHDRVLLFVHWQHHYFVQISSQISSMWDMSFGHKRGNSTMDIYPWSNLWVWVSYHTSIQCSNFNCIEFAFHVLLILSNSYTRFSHNHNVQCRLHNTFLVNNFLLHQESNLLVATQTPHMLHEKLLLLFLKNSHL